MRRARGVDARTAIPASAARSQGQDGASGMGLRTGLTELADGEREAVVAPHRATQDRDTSSCGVQK